MICGSARCAEICFNANDSVSWFEVFMPADCRGHATKIEQQMRCHKLRITRVLAIDVGVEEKHSIRSEVAHSPTVTLCQCSNQPDNYFLDHDVLPEHKECLLSTTIIASISLERRCT